MRLHTKIIILIAVITLGFGLGAVILVSRMMDSALDQELGKQAEIVAEALSDHITQYVIDGEILPVQNIISKVMGRTEAVEYIYMILKEQYSPIHFKMGFPWHLHLPCTNMPVLLYQVLRLRNTKLT